MASAQADLAELGIASDDGWWQNLTLDDGGEEQVSNAMHEEGEAESDGEETSMHQQGPLMLKMARVMSQQLMATCNKQMTPSQGANELMSFLMF